MICTVTFNPSIDYIVRVDDMRLGVINRTTYEQALPAAKGTVVNSVGAGDSSVAGFLAGLIETDSYETAFKMGLAAGSASAFSDHLARRDEVEALMAAN